MFTLFIAVALMGSALALEARGIGVRGVPVIVENPGAKRTRGFVSAGAPFPIGAVLDAPALRLFAEDGKPVALQAKTLSKWPDGSSRWVLLDFRAEAAANGAAEYRLTASGERPEIQGGASVVESGGEVALSNGTITFTAAIGGHSGVLRTADGKTSAEIVSAVEIRGAQGRVTSGVTIDAAAVYARGPARAAVELTGTRTYSDGVRGPFGERVEMFAASPYVRVEDTFVYAHFPGTHAKPENRLSLWKLEARTDDKRDVDVAALVADAESEGLVESEGAVAFWGLAHPFDFSRYSDETNVGEDCPGIALGVGKSCAALVGLARDKKVRSEAREGARLWAHTTPDTYAASGALGDFAPQRPGRFEDVEEGMRQILGFWLWFQDNDPKGVNGRGPWHGLFDWGDWQTRYADRQHRPTGWNYLQGRYGWDSNEMDTTLGLWSAFFHTGRLEYYRAAAAMARHVMDVDTIHVDYRLYKLPHYVYDWHHYDAPWEEGERLRDVSTVGMGRRHNVEHWGNGIGDTRHGWNGGVMMYYYLTGNRRAREVVLSMADMHVQKIRGAASGEYTLGLWCIYNAWQMTGQAGYREEFDRRLAVIEKLVLPDGSLPNHVDFFKGASYPEVDKEHGSYLDLTLDYVSNALADYHADTGDERARKILLGLAERNLADTPTGPADYQRIDALRLFAWAYDETGDKRYLERAKYHLRSLAAKPLDGEPTNAKEWLEKTHDLLQAHDWDIRVVGPAIRMAPYAMKAIATGQKCR